VIIAAVKINNYKNYELCITLKNGQVLKKTVPLELKYKTLEIIDSTRKKIYLSKINNENNPS
jgi:NADPH-dependent 7-cyano-7-deazaguanine reductase QueF-like protein